MVSSITTEEIFKKIREDPSNLICADCPSEEIKFASISHGSLICEPCGMIHKSLGPNISFVKSLTDSWSIRQLKIMTAGGNSTLRNFFDTYNMPSTSTIEFKYSTVAAKYYREMLKVMAEGEACTMPTPSVEEGLMLVSAAPVLVKAPPVEEEEQKEAAGGYFGSIFGSAINRTIGIGKGIYGKVKETETFQKIENKAFDTASRVGESIGWAAQVGKEKIEKTVEIGKEGLEWGAQVGKDKIGKTVEIGKESLEWGAHKGYEQLEWGASTGYNIGSKGVNLLKNGAWGAIDIVSNTASNTYHKINTSEQSKKIKEESWNLLNSIEKNTIGMVFRKPEPQEESHEEVKIDQPERVPTPEDYR